MSVHINAKPGDIAKTILLPGDPLRARFIANEYLENVSCYNEVRGMLGFTGTYKGRRISVQGTGMGMPSMGIYSYELIKEFGVENLIRIGTCGVYQPHLKLFDIILAQAACTDSNYAAQYNLPGHFAPIADFGLLKKAYDLSVARGLNTYVGNIVTSDVFYDDDPAVPQKWAAMGVLAVEMEAAALYMNAAKLGAKALAMMTVSDSLVTKEETTAEQRELGLKQMIELALDLEI